MSNLEETAQPSAPEMQPLTPMADPTPPPKTGGGGVESNSPLGISAPQKSIADPALAALAEKTARAKRRRSRRAPPEKLLTVVELRKAHMELREQVSNVLRAMVAQSKQIAKLERSHLNLLSMHKISHTQRAARVTRMLAAMGPEKRRVRRGKKSRTNGKAA